MKELPLNETEDRRKEGTFAEFLLVGYVNLIFRNFQFLGKIPYFL